MIMPMPIPSPAIVAWAIAAACDRVCSASPKDTHGPIVKTGPTAGQTRSRNKNGQWRKKRSDAGKPRGTS